jgi:hypothetical protein
MDEKIPKSLTAASKKYAESTSLRALVQLVPYVGGSLDMLFAGAGSKIQISRIEDLLRQLQDQFSKLQARPEYDEEELFDIVIMAMENATKARAAEKRKIYASIVVKHVSENRDIEESEMAMRVAASLEVVHLKILHLAYTSPLCGAPFDGLRVLTISERAAQLAGENMPFMLIEKLPEYPESILRNACAELVSKGLLYDEGIGRWDTKAMEFLATTAAGVWLLSWLTYEPKNA